MRKTRRFSRRKQREITTKRIIEETIRPRRGEREMKMERDESERV